MTSSLHIPTNIIEISLIDHRYGDGDVLHTQQAPVQSTVEALNPLAEQLPVCDVTVHTPLSPGAVSSRVTNKIAHEHNPLEQDDVFPDALLHTATVVPDEPGGPGSP